MDVRQMACVGAAGFLGALLVVAAISPAHGQSYQRPVTISAQKPMTESVPYGDLALALRHDRRVLYHRVSQAVGRVCPPLLDEEGHAYDWQECTNFAWRGADPQIKRAIGLARSGVTMSMSIEITAAPAR